MSAQDAEPTLSMREMAARSGVSEGTLRMWETRHGFPVPLRLPSGHRRYSELDLRRVRSVVLAREHGLSLPTAIARARMLSEEPRPSLFTALRDAFPHLAPRTVALPTLLRLSQAIEDESCVRAERPVLFGAFQHERFYRAVESRWRELGRTADRAVVLAEFARARTWAVPAEIPIPPSDPLMREWVIVCEAPRFAACLVGLERPPDGRQRRFETIWSVERPVVREATRICCELTARVAPELVADLRERLDDPLPPIEHDVRSIIELTTRMVQYAVEA